MMSCSSKSSIDIQGHRGCRGLLPENTLPAFEKAIDIGVHTLELDIAITKDHKVVVSHEPFMSRKICLDAEGNEIPEDLDKHYNLYQMTHQQIKQFDCGTKFHSGYPKQEKMKVYKPLLSEVFDMVKAKGAKVKFNIEIKSKPEYYGIYTPQPEAYVSMVLKTIADNGMEERSNLQSFDLNILEVIKKQSPNTKVALLVDEGESIDDKSKALSYKPEIISPYHKLLDETKIKALQAQGYEVIPWTINDVDLMKRFIEWEIDGIITDYPDQLKILLSN